MLRRVLPEVKFEWNTGWLSGYRGAVPVILPLPPTAILLAEAGSTAHGTGLPGGEDHDELAVVVERPADVLSLAEGCAAGCTARSPKASALVQGTPTARCTRCAGF